MAVLADLFISTPTEAAEYDKTQTVANNEDRAEFTSFTDLELSTLQAIIEGREWDVDMLDSYNTILEQDDGERRICELPKEFLERLASLDDKAITTASEAWAKTEELSCSPNDVRPIIEELRRLSQRACNSGRNVYLWNCV
jgi:hypothetical protein